MMSLESIMELMLDARGMGCKSVTITGGGEPLLHPKINDIVRFIGKLGIKIGLVTNGTQFKKFRPDTYQYITWCRISHGDHREFDDVYTGKLREAVNRGSNIDWAFSHVLSPTPNYKVMCNLIEFANEHNFTHVRLVSDLLDLDKIPKMEEAKTKLRSAGLKDDSLVIYQGRKKYNKGAKRCLISLLKIVVGADGKLYPCCGTQYALANPGLDYEKSMCMGDWTELKEIYKNQRCFDGTPCVKCYYTSYNDVLSAITKEIKHKEFV